MFLYEKSTLSLLENYIKNSMSYCSDPTCVGRNYILKWVFFVQTILADRYIHRREMLVVSLKNSSSVELEIKKVFLNFVFFFEELSSFKVLCENVIFGMILFTLRGIFVQIKIFSIVIQNHISRQKLNQFCVPNTRKAIRKRLFLVS